jgi:hypothetical protein
MTMWTAFDLTICAISFTAGGAFIWFCKDAVQKAVLGANALSAKLHAKADALAAAAKKA